MRSNFSIIDSLSDSAAILDANGTIQFVNNAWKLFGRENGAKEIHTTVGINYLSVCDNIIDNDSVLAGHAANGIRKVITRETETFELEYPCHSPNEQRWFILKASPMNDEMHTLVMHINITKRKLSEIEVEKNHAKIQILNNRLNSSIYKIAHDIQSPLNSIIGLVNLSKNENDISATKTYLDLINKSSTDLKSFITETLEYISSGSDFVLLDFHALVQSQISLLEPLLKESSIEVLIDIDTKKAFYTNINEFRTVFANLFTNAIKYCDEQKNDRHIKIGFQADETGAVLKITDNGIGIKNEDIPKLFERNYQVDSGSGGYGLGLFIVKKSVEMLEGKISVDSVPEHYTEFIVEIPNRTNEAIK